MPIKTSYKDPLIAASDVLGIDIPISRDPFYRFETFNLFNHNSFYQGWYSDKIVDEFGLIRLQGFDNRPHFLSIMEKEEALKYYNSINIVSYSNLVSNRLQSFVSYLWFVKDNSVNTGWLFIEDQSDNIVEGDYKYFSEERAQKFSKATGHYETTKFSREDLSKAENIMRASLKLIPNHYIKREKRLTDINPVAQRNPLYDVNYNSFNRIERSIQFLTQARMSSFLPFKIAFYMGVYECLFSTDKVEIGHKVAERASFYIGGDSSIKRANYSLVKDSYNLRSNYIHGGELDDKVIKKYNGIENICSSIDSLTRKILTKVILEDSDKFLMQKNKLDEWYTSLLFN